MPRVRAGLMTIGPLAVVLALTGCSSSGTRQAVTPASTTPASSAATAPPVTVVLTPPADRCGPPENAAAKLFDLAGPGGSKLPAVSVGTGSTYAVLLHQADSVAMCGFWPFANWLAKTHHVHVVLFDFCSYGLSSCPSDAFAADEVAQASVAVKWARAHGSRRVVLVGASMGGTIAVATAVATRSDAVVDLSGPGQWPPLDIARIAPKLTMPTLMAIDPGDRNVSYADLKAAFGHVPAVERKFVTTDTGHGWDMLVSGETDHPVWLPLATTVADWINGRY